MQRAYVTYSEIVQEVGGGARHWSQAFQPRSPCFDAFYGPATLPLSRFYGSLRSGGRGAGVSQGMVALQAVLWKPETAHQSVLSEWSM